jgi:hypothetical protein
MASEVTAKNGWYAFQILRAIKSIEAVKINKYLNPGYFFLGSYRSKHDSECQKSSLSAVRLISHSMSRPINVRMPTMSKRTRQCFCHLSVASVTPCQ